MKNRRSIIAVFLICACLVLSLGYAQIQSSLSITGGVDVTAKNTDLKVEFSGNVTIDPASEGLMTANASGLTATMTVKGISAKGQSVTATFEIINNMADVDGLVYEPVVTNASSDFSVECEFTKDSDAVDYKTLAPAETTTVTVTVTLNKTFTSSEVQSFTISLVTKSAE